MLLPCPKFKKSSSKQKKRAGTLYFAIKKKYSTIRCKILFYKSDETKIGKLLLTCTEINVILFPRYIDYDYDYH